ncbi:MAG: acyl-CoA thioesterase [Clostridia bacterium]|nr:acyl-CoA thioesterase [Clostridia bacterium]
MPLAKRVKDSRTEQVQILSQGTLNGYKRLFGGRLMEWIDIVAAVTARRHAGANVTTAAVDSLVFREAAYANDTLVLVGTITYVGKTSMEVSVRTFVEALDGRRHLINTAYLIMVALDENERPMPVPRLIPESEEELRAWEEGKRRAALRKANDDEVNIQ